MGKPFKKELEKVSEIYNWSLEQPKNDLLTYLKSTEKPILIVGSGGSLSACHYLALILQNKGLFAKAITPLEVFYLKNSLNNCNIILLSASGKNTDMSFGFKLAVQFEPNCIVCICMKKNSPLAKLSSQFSNTKMIEYTILSGQDGFLATNSLIAFYSIIYHTVESDIQEKTITLDLKFNSLLDNFFNVITKDYTLHVLYGGWGQSVAIDLESIATDAALGNRSEERRVGKE